MKLTMQFDAEELLTVLEKLRSRRSEFFNSSYSSKDVANALIKILLEDLPNAK